MGVIAENPEDFEQRLADVIDEAQLIPSGSTVLVGVSGGADSVAMLHAMHCLSRRGGDFELVVGHLDHSLREESPGDAQFVADLAGRLGLECIVECRDVSAIAADLGEGLEDAARQVRYEFFRKTAKLIQAKTVAVAHHADDNVETILFRILRGTGLRGLTGMAVSRSLSPDIEIIRPMLSMRRAEIIEYCQRRNLQWREDHTNADIVYRRNFIRNELLPSIRERINSQTEEALLRLGSIAGKAEEFLRGRAQQVLQDSVVHSEPGRVLIDVKMISAAEPIVRTTAIRLALEQVDMPLRGLSTEHLLAIDAMLSGEGKVVNLPNGFSARREKSHIIISNSRLR